MKEPKPTAEQERIIVAQATAWSLADREFEIAEERRDEAATPLEKAAAYLLDNTPAYRADGRASQRYTRAGQCPRLLSIEDRVATFDVSNGIDLHDDFVATFSLDVLANPEGKVKREERYARKLERDRAHGELRRAQRAVDAL